jgi:hypothetical protein
VKRARVFVFDRLRFTRDGVRFHYRIDDTGYSYFSSTRDARPTLDGDQRHLVAAHVGLAYLIDLATLCLPEQVVIRPVYLPRPALAFWRDTFQRLAMERVYAERLDVGCLDTEWISAGDVRLRPLRPADGGPPLLAMSGGKESLAALKLFDAVDGLGLFFLQYPARSWFHLARVHDALQGTHPTFKVRAEMNHTGRLQRAYGCGDYYTFVIGQVVFHALLYGDRYCRLIIGNEHSSNFGNATWQGRPVNHQYDKTLRFARRVNAYVRKYVNAGFTYFSPFFGLYEYRIAQLFLADGRYLPLWTSCNFSSARANFCGRCPKCAFTYVICLPWSSRAFLRRHFPADPLGRLDLYLPLMEAGAAKPLECVGEKKEVWLALYHVWRQGQAPRSPVVRYFAEHILPRIGHGLAALEVELNAEHTGLAYVPAEYRERIRRSLSAVPAPVGDGAGVRYDARVGPRG